LKNKIVRKLKKTAQHEMDTILITCFMSAIKTKVKDKDLPILVSTFYSSHMLACKPSDVTVDIKKSSYKKLSKLLEEMVEKKNCNN